MFCSAVEAKKDGEFSAMETNECHTDVLATKFSCPGVEEPQLEFEHKTGARIFKLFRFGPWLIYASRIKTFEKCNSLSGHVLCQDAF